MNDRVLLDTNILVYLYDIAEKSKRERALTVVDDLIRTTRAVIKPFSLRIQNGDRIGIVGSQRGAQVRGV